MPAQPRELEEVELRAADALAEGDGEGCEAEEGDDGAFVAPAPERFALSSLCPELRAQVGLGLPIITSSVLQMMLELTTMIAVGQLGVEQLDGAGLGRMLSNCTGIAPMTGLLMAMDTLSTQAYGAGSRSRVGEIAQRALAITGLVALPVAVFWWCAEPVLLLLGQDPAVSALATTYLRCFAPAMAPFLGLEVVKRYLQAQGMVFPITCLLLVAVVVHVAVTYLLTWQLGLGFLGGPLAFTASYGCAFLLGLGFVLGGRRFPEWFIAGDPLQCWGGWTRAAFQDWRPFMKLGLPSTVLVSLDWWSFEVLVFMTGLLGTVTFAASNIIMQLIAFLFMQPLGLSIATCIRVGQTLGAGDVPGARRSALVGLGMSATFGLINSSIVFGLLPFWARCFTDDAEVVGLVVSCRWILGALLWFDAMQAGMAGLLRGTGMQAYGAGVNFFSQWVVGLPLAGAFTFWLHCGLPGLYGGLLCGVMLIPFLDGTVLFRADWETLAKVARSRAGCADGDPGEP